MRKFILFTLVFVMASAYVPISASADTDPTPQFAPYTQEYIDYLYTAGTQETQVNEPLPINIHSGAGGIMLMDSLPEQYDSRKEDYTVNVKDQEQTNTCWTFSSQTVLETFLKKNTAEVCAFSERHMENATAQNPDDLKNKDAFNRKIGTGGSQLLSTAYYMRGAGPTDAVNMPFENNEVPEPTAELYQPVSAQILDYQYIQWDETKTNEENITELSQAMKYGVMQSGALDIGIQYDASYYHTSKWSYYNPQSTVTTNHAVTLVGWDDTYAKENFLYAPSRDGAWIVQNSWGSRYGEDGFFYVSYDELSVYQFNGCVLDAQTKIEYDNRYYHDPLGWNQGLGYTNGTNTAYGANVFQKLPGEESLTEVTFGTISYTDYEVYINPNGNELREQDLVLCASGTMPYAGYKTVKLDTPITLSGQTFAVVIKYYTPYTAYSVPIEAKIDREKSSWYTASAERGTSFLSADGNGWDEISTDEVGQANCSIKAFTKDITNKTDIRFSKPNKNSIVSIYDADGKEIPLKADETVSLPDGTYTYCAQTYQQEDINGQFTVKGEAEQVVTVDGKAEKTEYIPSVTQTTYTYPANGLSNGDLLLQIDYGTTDTASVALTVADENQTLTEGQDYEITDTGINMKKNYLQLIASAGTTKSLMLSFENEAHTQLEIQVLFDFPSMGAVRDRVNAIILSETTGQTWESVCVQLESIPQPYTVSVDEAFLYQSITQAENGLVNGIVTITNQLTKETDTVVYDEYVLYKAWIEQGEENTVKVTVLPNTDAVILYAVYDDEGMLKEVRSIPVRADSESITETVPGETDAIKSTVMVWSGMDRMSPFAAMK